MTQSTIGPIPDNAPAHPTPWTYSAATGQVEDALGNRLFAVERVSLGQDLVALVNRASGSEELAPRVRARIAESVGSSPLCRAEPRRVQVGDTFDGLTEPDVPVGTILRDNEGDQVKYLGDGCWTYVLVGGVVDHGRGAWCWQSGDAAEFSPYTVVSIPSR